MAQAAAAAAPSRNVDDPSTDEPGGIQGRRERASHLSLAPRRLGEEYMKIWRHNSSDYLNLPDDAWLEAVRTAYTVEEQSFLKYMRLDYLIRLTIRRRLRSRCPFQLPVSISAAWRARAYAIHDEEYKLTFDGSPNRPFSCFAEPYKPPELILPVRDRQLEMRPDEVKQEMQGIDALLEERADAAVARNFNEQLAVEVQAAAEAAANAAARDMSWEAIAMREADAEEKALLAELEEESREQAMQAAFANQDEIPTDEEDKEDTQCNGCKQTFDVDDTVFCHMCASMSDEYTETVHWCRSCYFEHVQRAHKTNVGKCITCKQVKIESWWIPYASCASCASQKRICFPICPECMQKHNPKGTM